MMGIEPLADQIASYMSGALKPHSNAKDLNYIILLW